MYAQVIRKFSSIQAKKTREFFLEIIWKTSKKRIFDNLIHWPEFFKNILPTS